ncbi:MAG: hypothetical protein DRG78_15920 [Epsilonproteobacteria bacterium]|nr:MAG: hypothetical protein DRG78_15920 [Campylobacterota bacterium]
MKIWISDTQTSSHRLVRLNCEEHSDYKYLGDLDDDELSAFFISLKDDIDVEKNIKLIKYYGYLHLFIIHKKLFDLDDVLTD